MPAPDFTMYWTGLKQFEDCPQQFLWQRGWSTIDLGHGMGKGKPKPLKKSEHHAVMGTVVQAVLERFYNDELWRNPKDVPATFEKLIDKIFRQEVAQVYIDWSESPSREEMVRIIRDAVLGYISTCKHNKLLGTYARSEVEYRAAIDQYNPVGGKLDFLIKRPDTGVTILDGKNSKDKGKYTDPDQLRWYALVYYLSHRVMPDRLGFIYFRYPYGYVPPEELWEKGPDGTSVKPEPMSGIDWVDFDMGNLKSLAERARSARNDMRKEKFPANPVPSKCKFCVYEGVCPERQAQIASNRRTKNSDVLSGEHTSPTGGFTII